MIKLVDRYGVLIRTFKTWKEANNFRIIMQRFDWRII